MFSYSGLKKTLMTQQQKENQTDRQAGRQTGRYRLLPGWVEVEEAGLAILSRHWEAEGSHHHQRVEGEGEEREEGSWSPPPLRRQRRCDIIVMSLILTNDRYTELFCKKFR